VSTPSATPPGQLGIVREQARRYLVAVYGEDVWFRAPETFTSLLERWIWAVGTGTGAADMAEENITRIEQLCAEREKGGT
jgi:hypothetical protein